jgi:hypothetical protein
VRVRLGTHKRKEKSDIFETDLLSGLPPFSSFCLSPAVNIPNFRIYAKE